MTSVKNNQAQANQISADKSKGSNDTANPIVEVKVVRANQDNADNKTVNDKTANDKVVNDTAKTSGKGASKADMNGESNVNESEIKAKETATNDDNTKTSLAKEAVRIKDAVQETVQETLEEVSEHGLKEGLKEGLDELKTGLLQDSPSKEELTDDIKASLGNAKSNLDNAKSSLKDAFVHRTSLVARAGNYLESLYKKDGYQAVDIGQRTFAQDGFRSQTLKLGQQLLGSKAITVQSLANKSLSQDKLNKISEAVYHKIAGVASAWAMRDLAKDERFLELSSDTERHAYADKVVAHSRVLAAAGGVFGAFGLKGVVLDTAWLLLLSLKSVFMLSAIYDKPLTGEDGMRIAYGVLAGANLEKLQEKQVAMTALALGDMVLSNADSTEDGLSNELKKVSAKYQSGTYDMYAKQFDELGKHVNLDLSKMNTRWVHRILPIASTLLATHYNSVLIDEVLGTALATFRGEQNLPKIEG